MKYTDNALNILTAMSYKGVGNGWIVKNLVHNKSLESIVDCLNKDYKVKKHSPITTWDFEQLKRKYESTIIEKMSDYCDGFVALGDNNFPQHRGNVNDGDRPVFLYYKGNIELLDTANKNISVIGLLNPTEDIEIREQNIVAQFVKNGATIVSGLALGCDSIAHREALNSNGKTIAILPSPLTSILPASNRGLAFQIVDEGGLLITEYGKDFKYKTELSTRYKERDRLQALFCDAIVLAASYSKKQKKEEEEREKLYGHKCDSGARLAMECAERYSIPRAVMYDEDIDKDNPMFELCREIIEKDNNVTIIKEDNYIEKVKDILSNKGKIDRCYNVQKNTLFD